MRSGPVIGACVWVAVGLGFATHAAGQPRGFDGHQVVKIEVADEAQLEVLRALDAASRDIEIWSEVLRVGVIEARVSPEQRSKLDASGLKYTVHIEDLQAHINEMYADRGGGFLDTYRSYNEHMTFLSDLAAQYPTLAQTIDLGQSVEGRTLRAIRITGPGTGKVGLLYHGAQHGNEGQGAMLVAYTANHLLTNYATDPEIQWLVDNVEWYLLPIMNPDGYEIYGRFNANEVDLNRNWGGPGSGEDPAGTGGPYPFSEPETTALRDFLLAHPNVRLHLDLHATASWFMWPWGHKWEHTRHHELYYSVGVEVRGLISAAGGYDYDIGSSREVSYFISGGSVDYSYGDLGLWAFLFELDDLTIPEIYDHYLSTLLYLASWVSDCNENGIADLEETASGAAPDCNDNWIPDECDLDCNTNFVPDECDIVEGSSEDCNINLVPDECDLAYETATDCNANAVLDECDLAEGTSEDCNGNEWPDECDLVGGTYSGFEEAVSYAAGPDALHLATGDLDNDGADDLVVADGYSDTVLVLLNDGSGTFAAPVAYSAGDHPQSVAIGDLDQDGDRDLAVANFESDDVAVLANNGDGTFALAVSYAVGESPKSVAMGDLDHDSHSDLAVANGLSDDVSILFNNGNGTFAPAVSYPVGDGPSSIAMGDLDHDGDQDLVVVNFVDRGVSVLLNHGDGSFATPVEYFAGNSAGSMVLVNLNSDTYLDLAVVTGSRVQVRLNNGDGTFGAYVWHDACSYARSIAAADLDNDGDDDLAVTCDSSGWDRVLVLVSRGDGTFVKPVTSYTVGHSTGYSSLPLAISDLDNDGDNDFAVANATSDDVSVLMNRAADYSFDCNLDTIPDECESFEACDFGGDGDVDLHDWRAFVDCLAGPGVGPGPVVERCSEACLAAFDLDFDGDVDLLDAAGFQELYTGGARSLCWVEDSVPGDGWIDARQPIDNLVEQNPAGWREVEIVFDSECEASLIEAGDFSIAEVCELGECDEVAPAVASFSGAGDVGTLTLDRPIDPKAWTVITFHGEYADDVIRLGYLPADADASGTSNAGDIVEVVEGTRHGGPLHQFDIDRSGSIANNDIIVLIDLLNGAEPFEGYWFKTLPPRP